MTRLISFFSGGGIAKAGPKKLSLPTEKDLNSTINDH
jgi:hypothetical protein